jgi:hypothetical protein
MTRSMKYPLLTIIASAMKKFFLSFFAAAFFIGGCYGTNFEEDYKRFMGLGEVRYLVITNQGPRESGYSVLKTGVWASSWVKDTGSPQSEASASSSLASEAEPHSVAGQRIFHQFTGFDESGEPLYVECEAPLLDLNDGWHYGCQKSFWDACLQPVSPPDPAASSSSSSAAEPPAEPRPTLKKISTNLARVMIRVSYADGQKRDLDIPYFFLSGGNRKSKIGKDLNLSGVIDRLLPQLCPFMDDFFEGSISPDDEKSKDSKVKKSEKLSSPEKAEQYRQSMIKFFELNPISITSEGHHYFDYPSNRKMESYHGQAADTLFEKSQFAYEFYDAEQSIRQFILGRSSSVISVSQDGGAISERFHETYKQLEGLPLKSKDVQGILLKEWMDYENQFIDVGSLFCSQGCLPLDAIINKLQVLKSIEIHIASHGDMCRTCQGTYWYDLLNKHHLEKAILKAILRKAHSLVKVPESDSSTDQKKKSFLAKASGTLKLEQDISFSSKSPPQFSAYEGAIIIVSSSSRKPKTDRTFTH